MKPPAAASGRALAGLLAAFVLAGSGQAATLQVAAGADLQAALDSAQPGDVVELQGGRFEGNFKIRTTLTLRGLQRPMLAGGLKGTTLRIEASDVVVEGLRISDSFIIFASTKVASTLEPRTGGVVAAVNL